MDLKSELINQEIIQKQKPSNNNILDDNNSDIHSTNKIFSNANSIIGLNVNYIFFNNNIMI